MKNCVLIFLGTLKVSEIERFSNFCFPITESGCWIWMGGLGSSGYGNFSLNGKTIAAHRMSYLLFNGEIPLGFCVRHSCDIKECVNPTHLSAGTYTENSKDTKDRGRCNWLSGEDNPRSTLTKEKVIEIIKSKDPLLILSKKYGVSISAISNIQNGKRWKCIDRSTL